MSPRTRLGRRGLSALAMLAVLGSGKVSRAQTAAPPMHRIAVLVGANDAPPGRAALRFAHDDAQQLADALIRVGRFLPADVHVLLDPAPAELAATLAGVERDVAVAAGDALFVFYYSGHSDGQSLYPHGEAVPVGGLRERIEHIGARIRVGILDTCRGGSWTQAKGLSVGPPLDAADLFNVSTEGTALMSSSSGLENAHEADQVRGSFFTHYFTAGLLGAADRAGDGNITLEEAFDYAKERTVRDSARLASATQHPSFDLQLRGRQDIVLTSVASSPSALEITQTSAAIEIIHLPSGVTIAEIPPSPRPLRIAVPPAHYLVRSVVDGRIMSHELEIRPGETASISGGQLEATGDARLALKGDEPTPPREPVNESSTPPAGWGEWEVLLGEANASIPAPRSPAIPSQGGLGLSSRDFVSDPSLDFGITDRLAWTFPGAMAYRIGTAKSFEVIPFGGLSGIGFSNVDGVLLGFSAGVDFRVWTAARQSLVVTFASWYDTALATSNDAPPPIGHYVVNEGSIGYAATLGDAVTLHFAVGADVVASVSGPRANPGSFVYFGGAQKLAYRTLPLVQVHVSRRFSFDVTASWGFYIPTGAFSDEYLGGFTYAF